MPAKRRRTEADQPSITASFASAPASSSLASPPASQAQSDWDSFAAGILESASDWARGGEHAIIAGPERSISRSQASLARSGHWAEQRREGIQGGQGCTRSSVTPAGASTSPSAPTKCSLTTRLVLQEGHPAVSVPPVQLSRLSATLGQLIYANSHPQTRIDTQTKQTLSMPWFGTRCTNKEAPKAAKKHFKGTRMHAHAQSYTSTHT
jgi:hypothetical protein